VALAQAGATGGGDPIHELVDDRGQRVPLVGQRLVAGRGAQCEIRLSDELASRNHFQLRSTPAGWQIEDLGSTNGTFLNSRRLPPGVPVPVALSDRITVGHTTFVMQRSAASRQPSAISDPRIAESPDRRMAVRQSAIRNPQSAIPLWQWLLAALVVAAAAILAYGAFQPWVQVQVQLTFGGVAGGELLAKGFSLLDGVFQDVFNKPPMVTANTVKIFGMNTYGWFTLLAGCVAALMAALDLALRLRRSALPGIVYVLAALLPGVVLAGDIQRLMRLGTVPILFGVNLFDIFQGASKIMEPKVTPLSGLYMTATGLALLLGAGVVRSILPALTRRSQPNSPVL
jgi:pSer/pThr/pTyr-binding forkhead associated (FHA) protein